MKTVEIEVFKFEELSEDAKGYAVSKARIDVDTQYIYDDAHKTVKAFHKAFNTNEGRNSWLDVRYNHFDDNVLELKGLRLQKYLWNNFKDDLFKGKYFSLWSKKDVSFKYYKDGYPVLKKRYSKVILENFCVFTGVCHDDSLLQPMYDFLNAKLSLDNTTTFEEIIDDCFNNLRKDIENECDSIQTDEYIEAEIIENDYDFTENGERF